MDILVTKDRERDLMHRFPDLGFIVQVPSNSVGNIEIGSCVRQQLCQRQGSFKRLGGSQTPQEQVGMPGSTHAAEWVKVGEP